MNNKSIIICTYNEFGYVSIAVEDIRKNIKNFEIVLVDDNSTDGTINEINNIKNNNDIKFILRKKTRGLGSAFLRGLIESKGDYIGWIDTNMTYLTTKFLEMENLLNEGQDIVILSRYAVGGKDERPMLRSLSSKYLNLFCKILFRSKIKDFTSGIFLMKRTILNEVSVLGYGHGDFFIEFLYNVEKKGFKIYELPYVQKKDLEPIKSKSAPNIVKFIHYGIKYIMRITITLFRST